MIRLLLFLLVAGWLTGYAFWVYLRAELPVRRARILAAVRAVALVLLALVLFDPPVPWGASEASRARWVLLDASLSMSAGDAAAWSAARRRASRLEEEGWQVVRFGDGLASPGDPEAEPTGLATRLGPALARAAEAGVRRVTVLSDLRFEDPVAVRSALSVLGSAVGFEATGGGTPNAGVSELVVTDQTRLSDPVLAEVEVFADGVGDSVHVERREEGVLVGTASAAAPAPGLRARLELELPPASGPGRRRYTARVRAPGDGFPSDDEAVTYITAGHEEGGLVVVSLRPDWEPRALYPVLEEATGLPTTGYLRAGPDRFLPMGPALRRGPAVDSATVGAAVADAGLVVLHGLDGQADAWGRTLPRRTGRAVLWPVDGAGADLVGLGAGAPRGGEWYASSELPASPLAADLAGARFQDLPPLSSLLVVSGEAPGVAPLHVQPGGTGPGQPALLLRREGGRREAVVLVSGLWRWAVRTGDGRDAYRRLWSGVAGWLLEEDRTVTSGEARPSAWVFPRGTPVRWRIPGGETDSTRVTVTADSAVVWEGVLRPGSEVATDVLPPGSYRYRAESSDATVAEGRFDVEARTLEMLPAPLDVGDVAAADGPPARARGGGAPLSTTPWPYLLALALLSAEWIGRRRVGLR
ncbi:MAG TPA: hypothetical protein VK849_02230 [Longimicrobiales bacterium]|nr:hypothetical protein [Longimicrobiales bacterium]